METSEGTSGRLGHSVFWGPGCPHPQSQVPLFSNQCPKFCMRLDESVVSTYNSTDPTITFEVFFEVVKSKWSFWGHPRSTLFICDPSWEVRHVNAWAWACFCFLSRAFRSRHPTHSPWSHHCYHQGCTQELHGSSKALLSIIIVSQDPRGGI